MALPRAPSPVGTVLATEAMVDTPDRTRNIQCAWCLYILPHAFPPAAILQGPYSATTTAAPVSSRSHAQRDPQSESRTPQVKVCGPLQLQTCVMLLAALKGIWRSAALGFLLPREGGRGSREPLPCGRDRALIQMQAGTLLGHLWRKTARTNGNTEHEKTALQATRRHTGDYLGPGS